MTAPTHDMNDVLRQITGGAYDDRLNEIAQVVNARLVAADPWDDIHILSDIAQQIRLMRNTATVDRAKYGAEAHYAVRNILKVRGDDPLVRPLLDIVRRDIFTMLLDMPPERADQLMAQDEAPPPPAYGEPLYGSH